MFSGRNLQETHTAPVMACQDWVVAKYRIILIHAGSSGTNVGDTNMHELYEGENDRNNK
jgi:hypothetical protein